MQKVLHELNPEMKDCLQGQTIVLLNVLEKESNSIYSTALSWVFALDKRTIRFAIDAKSDFVKMLEEDPRLVLQFVGPESIYSITAKASVKVRQTEGLTLKLALLECEIEEIRDIIFYGGKIVSQPAYVKTYNPDLVKKLDNEVKEAIMSL